MTEECTKCKKQLPENHGISVNMNDNSQFVPWSVCTQCAQEEFWNGLSDLLEKSKSVANQSSLLDRINAFQNTIVYVHTNPKRDGEDKSNGHTIEGLIAGISKNEFHTPHAFDLLLAKPFGSQSGNIERISVLKTPNNDAIIISTGSHEKQEYFTFLMGGISQQTDVEHIFQKMLFRDSEVKRSIDHERINLANSTLASLPIYNTKVIAVIAIILSVSTYFSYQTGIIISIFLAFTILISTYHAVRALVKLETMKYNVHASDN